MQYAYTVKGWDGYDWCYCMTNSKEQAIEEAKGYSEENDFNSCAFSVRDCEFRDRDVEDIAVLIWEYLHGESFGSDTSGPIEGCRTVAFENPVSHVHSKEEFKKDLRALLERHVSINGHEIKEILWQKE